MVSACYHVPTYSKQVKYEQLFVLHISLWCISWAYHNFQKQSDVNKAASLKPMGRANRLVLVVLVCFCRHVATKCVCATHLYNLSTFVLFSLSNNGPWIEWLFCCCPNKLRTGMNKDSVNGRICRVVESFKFKVLGYICCLFFVGTRRWWWKHF